MADTIEGFDVSHFQKVDWPSLVLNGRKFCFMKASDGASRIDPTFSANWAGAKSAGLIRGAYHFFRPGSSTQDQVSNFLRQVPALGPQELPPALDLEIPDDEPQAWSGMSPAQAADLALGWLNGVQTALGRIPMIYTNLGFYNQVLRANAGPLKAYALWFARFTSAADPGAPHDWHTWNFWQYSTTGKIQGITSPGGIDLDRFNGGADALSAFIAASVVATPAVSAATASGDAGTPT